MELEYDNSSDKHFLTSSWVEVCIWIQAPFPGLLIRTELFELIFKNVAPALHQTARFVTESNKFADQDYGIKVPRAAIPQNPHAPLWVASQTSATR